MSRHVNVWTHPVTKETYRTTWVLGKNGPKRIRNRLIAVDGKEPPKGYVGEIPRR